MIEQNRMRRNRHNEELLCEELIGIIATIGDVAEVTGKSFEQVADIFRSQAINRLTEVLIDAGDKLDDKMDDFKSFASKELSNHRNWCYDNQPLQVEIRK